MAKPLFQLYRSVTMGRFLKATLITSLFFFLIIIFYYVYSVIENTSTSYNEYLFFKQSTLVALPFILIFLIFFFAIWVYALYVDLNNLFYRFDRSPTGAMLWVILPFINFIGWGIIFSKIINYLDEEKRDEYYEKKGYLMKVSLSFFYAGLFGILLTLAFSFSLSVNAENFASIKLILYNAIQFIFILAIMGGWYFLIESCNSIIQYRAAVKLSQEGIK